MPELPEVETTLRGIKPHIIGATILSVIIRHPCLRWPIPTDLADKMLGQVLKQIKRRNKYLLFEFASGTLILHLGMSGRLSILSEPSPAKKHDHVDICFANKKILRFTDPRRFGALLFTTEDPEQHTLLVGIGPEPLTPMFSGEYLFNRSRKKKLSVKAFIMDGKVVAGVGNIYATEALYQAGIHPKKAAGKITRSQYDLLAKEIKAVLKRAIKKGGTSLKDFMQSDGTPGYFSIELQVYGRAGKPCLRCGNKLRSARIGQRSTVYCTHCQG